jgi:hypothetical protein
MQRTASRSAANIGSNPIGVTIFMNVLSIEEQLEEVNCNLDCINESIENCKSTIEWEQFELKQLETQKDTLLKEQEELSTKLVG